MSEFYLGTGSGKRIDLVDLDRNEYDIVDIADSLSKQWRWAGHLKQFYSVAQHCCIVAKHVSDKNALSALLHDASEAYLLDIPRPIKRLVPQYIELENKLQTSIAGYFGFKHPMPDEVVWIDDRVLVTEHFQLRDEKAILDWEHFQGVKPLDIKIIPWSSDLAKYKFLNLFNEIDFDE